MIIDKLEKALLVIGGKVIMIGGGLKNFDEFDITDDNTTTELVITHRIESPTTKINETRYSLNELTKKQICEQAQAVLGIDLNFRTEKKELISQYLIGQTSINEDIQSTN